MSAPRPITDSAFVMLKVAAFCAWSFLLAFTFYSTGFRDGRWSKQRERLTEQGCKQIASEPELWDCPNGERVEVTPP